MKNDLIAQRLSEINAVIPFSKILGRHASDADNIAKYYKLNRIAYSLINSKQGFVHMGISRDGIFKETDFLEHANLISTFINETDAKHVLELAAGKAAITKYLAKKYPSVEFTGLDLPHGQLDVSSSKSSNLKLVEGNYHDLSRFDDKSFDVVYIIEALCHSGDKKIVMQEVSRVLKSGGIFIIFDGYASKNRSSMTERERLVSDLTFGSIMVTNKDHSYIDLLNNLQSSGFKVLKDENLSKYVLPTMERFEKKAMKYFQKPIYSKVLNALLPNEVTGNAVAAYLMPLSVKAGLHEYWVTVSEKKF